MAKTQEEKNMTFIEGLKRMGFKFETITEEMLVNAPAGNKLDTGVAYAGAMVGHAVLTLAVAKRIAEIAKLGNIEVSYKSLEKVIYLQGIAKALMFIPEKEDWKIKRGEVYGFNPNLKGVLKCGERSIQIAMNEGVTFTEEEFEAMRICDKEGDDLKAQKYLISPLSMIVIQANDLTYAMEKNRRNC